MYFQTRTINVVEKATDMVIAFNTQNGVDIGLRLDEKNRSCGTLMVNTTENTLKEIILNPEAHGFIESNRVYIYTVLHELGHAFDILNHHADAQSYFGNYRRNNYRYEIRAWELGIKWALENRFISPVNFPNLKKYMISCLESYSAGKYNSTEATNSVFSNLEGGK